MSGEPVQTIILCGGLGTRLQEETEFRPKPMVPIGGRPILWHIMKIYEHYGYTDFVLPLGYKGEMIKEYFYNYHLVSSDVKLTLGKPAALIGNDSTEDWTIIMADTGQDTMKSGRLKRVERYLTGDTVMMTYGDGVADIDISKLVAFHNEMGKVATITAVSPAAQFGELKIDGNLISRFKEKEQIAQHYVSGGFMVFDRERFFEMLDDSIELEHGILRTLTDMRELAVYKHPGRWACMDNIRDREYLTTLWTNDDAFWKVW